MVTINRRSDAIRIECGRILRGASAIAGKRSFGIVVSSEEKARDGLALDMEAWDLPRSGRCPLIDSHLDGTGIRSVLGYVDNFAVRTIELPGSGRVGKALLGTAHFAEASVSREADDAYQKYLADLCDSFSVSFIPQFDGRNFVTPTSQELIEVSCVAVGADPNSRVISRALRRKAEGRATFEDRKALFRAKLARLDVRLAALEAGKRR